MMRKTSKRNGQASENEGLAAPSAAQGAEQGVLLPSVWSDPWGLMRDFDRHFDEMRRLIASDFLPSAAVWTATPGLLPGAASYERARTDLVDEGKEYVLTADLPGFQKDQVSVEVTPTGLTLEARREQEKSEGSEAKGYLARERATRSVRRVLEFPEEAHPDGAVAELKDGVLTVRVPKANPVEPKKTKVLVK